MAESQGAPKLENYGHPDSSCRVASQAQLIWAGPLND